MASYINVADADTFFNTYVLEADAWECESQASRKIKALNHATRLIDRLNFAGTMASIPATSATATITILSYNSLIDDIVTVDGVALTGSATAGVNKFEAITSNDVTAANLATAITESTDTTATSIANIITITDDAGGVVGNSKTLSYTDLGPSIGLQVSGVALTGGVDAQSLFFPREGDLVVPRDIKEACCYIALALLDGIDPELEFNNLSMTEQDYGGAKIKYDRSVPEEHVIAGIPSVSAWRLLKPYLRDPRQICLFRN